MSKLASLLCGETVAGGFATVALNQLSSSIDNFSTRAINFLKDDITQDTLTFGPFCARVLLENACAAIMGRLDSFRLLYLSEFQSQPEYEPGKKAHSAFSWKGDVIPEDNTAKSLWHIDHQTSKISRALFSIHMGHVYWQPAVEKTLDFAASYGAEAALSEILELDAENYVNMTKGRGSQLYSTLSKGVHWEFFSSALVFDEATVKTAIRETCLLVGQLALISHFIPTSYAPLTPEKAFEIYVSFRKDIP